MKRLPKIGSLFYDDGIIYRIVEHRLTVNAVREIAKAEPVGRYRSWLWGLIKRRTFFEKRPTTIE